MHSDQHGVILFDISFNERQMQTPTDRIPITVDCEFSVLSLHEMSFGSGDCMLICNSVMNKINDSADLDVMLQCKFLQVFPASHGPVFIHDLYNHCGRQVPS